MLLKQKEPVDMKEVLLIGLLVEEAPKEKRKRKSNRFKPTFNVREEFCLWVREGFPDLKRHAKNKTRYATLSKRKDEVLIASRKVYRHVVRNTYGCSSGTVRRGWDLMSEHFEKGVQKHYSYGLNTFVERIESISMSLGGDKYYTKQGYGNGRRLAR